MTEIPPPSVSVSPTDKTSDRLQSDADQTVVVQLLAQLDGNAREAAASAERLTKATLAQAREAREQEHRASRRWRISTMIGLATVIVLVAAGAVGFIVGAKALTTIADTSKSSVSTRNTILDCVEPSGKCYQAGQLRTAQLVRLLNTELNAAGVIRAACAQQYAKVSQFDARVADITACIAAHPVSLVPSATH